MYQLNYKGRNVISDDQICSWFIEHVCNKWKLLRAMAEWYDCVAHTVSTTQILLRK